MEHLLKIIAFAQTEFQKKLRGLLDGPSGGLALEQYVRYLSMQYHLTNGVQKHFFRIAGHPLMARRRSLRKFLVTFGNEEELHYEIALNDLKQLGREPLECPVDVTLWWSYFDSIIDSRPFLRLGATAILENIATASSEVIPALFAKANFINEKNSRFFVIHQHGPELAHGDQVLEALKQANLTPELWADLARGAEIGAIIYLRLVDWSLDTESRSKGLEFAQGTIAA